MEKNNKNELLQNLLVKTLTKNVKVSTVIFTPIFMISACTSQAPVKSQPAQKTANVVKTAPKPVTPSYQPPKKIIQPTKPSYSRPQGYQSFYDWKNDFAHRAEAKGYHRNDIQRLLNSAQYNSRVVSLDNNQAEFVKMPWEYVESAVSNAKIQKGRSKYSEHASVFSHINHQYHVSPYTVAAIWGMESAYGAVTGNSNLASSLATLAYEGRRRDFAEEQLFALLTLLSRGDVYWSNMKGSWAGGMGQTQFIPATWLSQGVDGNSDGQKNPWTTADALSSTANYLANSGWIQGLSPFYEVKLPAYFDYTQTGLTKSIAQWQQLGIQVISGYANTYTSAKLWLPAGKDGPALLLTKNFDVIKVYNNSSSYALGVSLLAKSIAGESGLIQSWPKYERPLTKGQVKILQQRLTNAGYNTQGVDGVIGTNTRKAFQRWQAANGQIADGFICQRTTQSLIW